MRPIRPMVALAACATMALGCARTDVTTQVKADGSWTRTLRFEGENDSALQDTFLLPHGAPWTISRSRREQGVTYLARRSLGAGETARNDIVVKSRNGSMDGTQLVNEVTVRPSGDGRIEYREVLRWRGGQPARWANPDPGLLRTVRATLPAGTANDLDARSLARTLLRDSWRLWFGPGDPLLSEATLHPHLAARQHRLRLVPIVERRLSEQFGGRLAGADRVAAARHIAAAVSAAARIRRSDGSAPLSQDDYPLAALTLAARLPGRVVATNGNIDPESGEVFWGLYSWAPALEEVVLTATCEPAPAVGAAAGSRRHSTANRPQRQKLALQE